VAQPLTSAILTERSIKDFYPSLMSSADTSRGESRLVAARRRARAAKIVLAAGGLAVFGLGMTLAKANVAGHSPRTLRPLEAPRRFQATVRGDALSGGLLAPAQAPPRAVTSQS
jgi:hypothetical protein